MTAPAFGSSDEIARQAVASARGWLGTPYRKRASTRGSGADCLGLLRGIWRDLLGDEPCVLPMYSDDWLELSSRDLLLDRLRETLHARDADCREPGRVAAFRFGRNNTCKHVGILTTQNGAPAIIHSYFRFGVVETTLDQSWQRRLFAVFEFPSRSI